MCVVLGILQCDKYRKGVIGGSACSSLCEKDTLYLGKCFSAKPGSQVSAHALLHGHASPMDFLFGEGSAPPPLVQVYSGSWGDLEGVIKCQMEDTPRYDLGGEMEPRREVGAAPAAGVAPAAAFNTPTKGTSVQRFREMILNHLKVGFKLTSLTECFLSNLFGRVPRIHQN